MAISSLALPNRSGAPKGDAGSDRPIRVLVVDDSVVIRRLVTQALSEDDSFEVAGVAANGVIALQKIPQVEPDVLTLDIEMPEMDGLETLRRVKDEFPKIKVVMFSTLTERGGRHTLEALSLGADDYVTKAANVGSLDTSLARLRGELSPKIKQFFAALTPRLRLEVPPTATTERGDSPAPGPQGVQPPSQKSARQARVRQVDVVAIGVSTGGPNALAEMLPKLPNTIPCPIVITQHMPPMFTRLLAERLSKNSQIDVREAEEGDVLRPGLALLAPGGKHLRLRRRGHDVVARLDEGPQENSCRPAVDVMFRSVKEIYGAQALAVIMTGMGKDGLAATEPMFLAGSPVIAQDRASSVVWGMPGYIVESGLADVVAPLGEIADEIMQVVTGGAQR